MAPPHRLSHLLATEKDLKATVLRTVTDFYHRIEKAPLMGGLSRRYRSIKEDGEQFPPESTIVQLRVEETFPEIQAALTTLFDAALVKEDANQTAKADIVVDGIILVPGVPVCALLFLEKQLVDLTTLVSKLPVLDPSERWVRDETQNCWATPEVETHKTKKVSRPLELAPATDKHPAQVKEVIEDVVVGYWATVKFSGAVPATRKAAMVDRVNKLRAAVKVAREEANLTPVGSRTMGTALLNYVFGK